MSPTLPRGMLTRDQLGERIQAGDLDTVLAVFPDLYGRLVGKRITGEFFLDHTADHGMQACDYLLTVDMEMDVVPGYAFANWQSGYGDVHCTPDWQSLRQVSWLERSALVFCDLEREGTPVAVAPRSILKAQVERLARAGCRAMCGSELEFYLFRDSYQSAREKKYEDLEPWGWYLEDYHIFQGSKAEVYHGAVRRHLGASGVPIELSKGEWGPGQHEINIRCGEAVPTADRHALFKQGCKEIAHQQGAAVSFMAKWRADLAGSSMHLHLSLWDLAGGANRFAGDQPEGAAQGSPPAQVSPAFRHFLGGWMAHARAIAPFYAPNPNSYKRYVHQSWAPTAIAWSHDNRTAGFRVVGRGPSLRIECRIPGADANPYLAYAATLAAGLDGMAHGTEPPAAFTGDAYGAAGVPRLPASLREATDEMEGSAMLRAALGDEVVAHYAHFFRTEQRKCDEAVTSWERARYFERG